MAPPLKSVPEPLAPDVIELLEGEELGSVPPPPPPSPVFVGLGLSVGVSPPGVGTGAEELAWTH